MREAYMEFYNTMYTPLVIELEEKENNKGYIEDKTYQISKQIREKLNNILEPIGLIYKSEEDKQRLNKEVEEIDTLYKQIERCLNEDVRILVNKTENKIKELIKY